MLATGERRYFLTWGQLFGAIKSQPLVDAVKPHLERMARGDARTVEVCDFLQEAAGEHYFFEAFFSMCQGRIPFGPSYEEWAAETRRQIEAGKEIYYLGVQGDIRELATRTDR